MNATTATVVFFTHNKLVRYVAARKGHVYFACYDVLEIDPSKNQFSFNVNSAGSQYMYITKDKAVK